MSWVCSNENILTFSKMQKANGLYPFFAIAIDIMVQLIKKNERILATWETKCAIYEIADLLLPRTSIVAFVV